MGGTCHHHPSIINNTHAYSRQNQYCTVRAIPFGEMVCVKNKKKKVLDPRGGAFWIGSRNLGFHRPCTTVQPKEQKQSGARRGSPRDGGCDDDMPMILMSLHSTSSPQHIGLCMRNDCHTLHAVRTYQGHDKDDMILYSTWREPV